MVNKSPSALARQIEQEVSNTLRQFDLSRLGYGERENLLELRQDLANVRIYSSAYELSEVREEQAKNARLAKQWLAKANKKLLKASETNIFGPVDVAHLGAQIEQLKSELK